ncbi:NlpC/P60 family protein [Bacillus atrophaeus]|uniref:C40 family peptidase n=1 Tax=Bacillus atrophaeus TaxID=1452 RepID=UPI002281653C|nr:NlpC/P60 family protein [Bacillus atrophaeus]MCY8497757.1 NlpC/P60 family protein [Bacillus atrophaeus]MCY8814938.1 NlpC/P60 family protein [Bacillus atrophaeus]MCY8821560.1 NlpC/P60 family protein [Bacillus atrophaeus]MCY8830990.1 NlpC/P60 family protein [Bacillus atrophaeus]MCY8835249.1 NlpC/P60 family protein [Bacillus atrophaeus]
MIGLKIKGIKLLIYLILGLIFILFMGLFYKAEEDQKNQDDTVGGGAACSVTGKINETAWNKQFETAGVFSGKQDVFVKVAEKQGIDPVLFAAISFHETGHGTSRAVIEKNNPGGLMGSGGLMVFSSIEEGIEAMGRTLHNRILKDGKTTIKALGAVYAPVGAANDPTNLNANWVPTIEGMVKKLGGLTMNCEDNGFSKDEVDLGDTKGALNYYKTVLSEAKKFDGTPYVFGGANPSTGFDCSGLMQWTFRKAGIELPRTANEQYKVSQKIPPDKAKPGDLVFFEGTYNAGVPITHVGIYTGNGKMYNSNGSGVEYSSITEGYWKQHLAGFGRVK